MSDSQFAQLRDIIYKRSGISFQDSKKYVLESRLTRRLEDLEMDSFDHYIAYLTMGPYQTDEFQEMFNRITINETSFFRNQPQLDVFEKTVLPNILEARQSTKRLRIWSAACSSGEEPYTLAMLIHRSLGVRLADWRVEILGTDISEKVLLQAEQAEYTSFSFRGVSPLLVNRYFSQQGDKYILSPEVKQMVMFEAHNLNDTLAAKRHGKWDIIFCRNVMIYFDDEMRARVFKMFHDCMERDAVLFIGHSETVRTADSLFQPLGISHAFAYTKAGA
ncbi:MAG: protein-glutamate O-methyltransferase CheR [Deltaproteobacteria bacterium]|nr:protein-glutamate O-methyltransferase CheR [Deltaproteobacteria bacterium]